MLSRLATVLHNAVDALAPPLPLQEEFVFHWKGITNFYIDKNSDSTGPVEETNIPAHLQQMLKLLTEEEEEASDGSTGPCLEYVLQHKLLDMLYSLAKADCPVGMKQHILIFFSQLLTRLKQPLLPHISAHRPVQHLVKMCGEIKAGPTEMEEIQLLCILCAKLRDSPHLVSFFLENSRKPNASGESTPVCSVDSGGLDYPLVNSLLTLCQSADNRVTTKACEGLMLCASLPEAAAVHYLLEGTQFCAILTERLISLYAALPKTIDPNDIELVEAKWGLDTFNFSEDVLMFHGKRQLVTFLSWLDYCDQLINAANASVGSALAQHIRLRWLEEIFQPSLLDLPEPDSLVPTAYLTRCIRLVSSQALLKEFSIFVVGESRDPEILGLVPHRLKQVLLDRCADDNNELNMITLKLFEVLIEKTSEHALHSLVLCNLLSRDYFDHSLADYHDSWSDEEDERMRRGCYDADISPGSSPISRTLAPSNIHKIINCFMLLLPDELKSSDNEEDNGYENYLRDAHRQFRDCAGACTSFDWPREAIPRDEQNVSDCSSSESQAEADHDIHFYEGSFLKMLFDKLEALLEQPYEVNLQVTSIVSKLAMLPHPYLHEFMLNPLIPQMQNARTLFVVLEKVAADIQVKMISVPNFKRQLHLTRKQLLGDSEAVPSAPSEGDGMLEGIIVFEEFCKELAAIAFVKYHASS